MPISIAEEKQKKITTIFNRKEYWFTEFFKDNNDRANTCVDFVNSGNQWSDKEKGRREQDGVSTLTINDADDVLKRTNAEMTTNKLVLSATAANYKQADGISEDVKKANLIVNNIFSNTEIEGVLPVSMFS